MRFVVVADDDARGDDKRVDDGGETTTRGARAEPLIAAVANAPVAIQLLWAVRPTAAGGHGRTTVVLVCAISRSLRAMAGDFGGDTHALRAARCGAPSAA